MSKLDTTKASATTASVTLDTPIKRGEQTITEIVLRKPASGELRGLKLVELMQLDVAALQNLIPRISSPTLTAADAQALDPADLMAIGVEIQSFFLTKADRGVSSPTA